jgi:peptide/nickel transport system substrate-binding protein
VAGGRRVALLFALSLCALGCLAQPKVLRYASQVDPGSMDPHAVASAYNARVLNQVYEPLVGRDERFRIAPRLALSWAPIEGGWRFKLRPGVKFHDGAPFSADDVVFSVERGLAPSSQLRVALPNVTGARRVDDLTVDVLTSAVTPTLPLAMTNFRIMSRAWASKHHVEKPQNFNAKEETFATRNANGTGPFVLKRWDPDSRTVLTANPGYWGQRGNVSEAQYLVIATAATRMAGLLSGEIDIVVDPSIQDVEKLRQSPGVVIGQAVGVNAQYMSFNFAHDRLKYGEAGGRNPFRDLRVRQAVRYAIDVRALQSKVMRGFGKIGSALFSPAVDGWEPRFERVTPYEPERARALLKDAGYPDGFSVTLDCSIQAPADAICQAIAGMLARVGIRVTHQPLQFNQLLPKVTSGDSSMFVIGWQPLTIDAEGVLVPLAHSRNPRGDGQYNDGGYSNPKVDALIDLARVEPLGGKRSHLLAEAMAALDADCAFVPITYRQVVWAMRKNVKTPIMPNDSLDLRFVTLE